MVRELLEKLPFVGLLLVGSVCASCTSAPTNLDLWPILGRGGFVPYTGWIDLRGSPVEAVQNPDLWLPKPVVAGQGWGRARRGWYPIGERSLMSLPWRGPAWASLGLDLRNRHAVASGTSYTIDILINGLAIGTIEAPPGRSRAHLPLPAKALKATSEMELRFRPAVEPLADDELPLAVLRLGLLADPEEPLREPVERWAVDPQAKSLSLFASGAYIVPVDLPEDAREIGWQARVQGGDGAELRLYALEGSGARRALAAVQVGGLSWQDFEASLADLGGSSIDLVVEADLSTGASRLELRALGLSVGRSDAGEEPDPAGSGAATSRPDIVLIILDAARGDRFPGGSYSRQTVPSIADMASRALVFRHAFAECPTTSCSIPALLTGVSFLGGGEVGGGRRLGDSATTLAEYLQELGYRTVGFSATPNNSASRNLHQGFDEFRELWGRGNPDHGPFNMSRLTSEVLRSQPSAEPLYLQLHYLPPHQPYDPGARFDRFTDPDYDGPIRPEMSLRPYSLGVERLAGKDLEHLIGLYDGNLLRADAAVAEVFSALRETGRWQSALILITSDHGEAFMEHGRQGHNSTLFDEMLHVPLIVRLPGGEVPAGVDTERPVSLLDVVPSLLGRLGVAPAAEVDGQDLLDARAGSLRSRVLFFRTSHPKNLMLAARTPAWKAISWPRHQAQMLFRIDRDPGERHNLLAEHPLVYAGLGLRIRRHLEAVAGNRFEGDPVELTPEAEETLRALGYLD